MTGPAHPDQITSATATDSDRRRSRRNDCSAKGWLSAEAGSGGRNYRVSVANLSLHGMGFSCEMQLTPESIHWIVLDAGGLRASSRVRIVSCRKREGEQVGYEYGAEFF